MKAIVGFICGAILMSAGAAAAGEQTRWYSNGIICETGGGGIVCLRASGTGYGVAISRQAVIVRHSNGRMVFVRYQP